MTQQQVIDKARSEGRSVLTEIEAKELLKKAGINVVDTRLATSKEEAVSISQQLGLPAALKIASSDVVHKSDAGGVKLDLKTAAQVGKAYDDIMKAIKKQYPDAKIEGVSVQTMARPGVVVIIGMSKDAQFGPVIMFGLGGIFVEILKDVSFRVAPLAQEDIDEMVKEIKGYKILTGMRGERPKDIEAIKDILAKLSEITIDNPEIKEIDLNPVIVHEQGVSIVDSRVILGLL